MAQCRLPFSFSVLAKLPPVPGRKSATQRKRKRVEHGQGEGGGLAPEPRFVRPRLDPSSEQIYHPAPDVNYQSSLQDVQSHEFNPPPLVLPIQPPRDAGANSGAISPPRTNDEPIPTLTEVNPEAGSIRGGARIWLKGINFSSCFPLFARFGTTVVATVRLNHLTSGPNLIKFLRPSPPATSLSVICPPQPCQASLTLHYRGMPRQTCRDMEPVLRGLSTWEIMIYCKFLEHNSGPALTIFN